MEGIGMTTRKMMPRWTTINIPTGTYEEIVSYLADNHRQLVWDGWTDIRYRVIESEYAAEYEIDGKSPESDDEYEARLKREAKAKEAAKKNKADKEDRDRKEYERLKAKYE
jgi:hypothetical protein